ncbi:hypothetical protein [Candidatus Rariloculus sp.]|uniref:hypothetical protein n=1 Tax=Candidatus Rariloculus sp. TaxID=3101265 RepID=UPI003D138D6F
MPTEAHEFRNLDHVRELNRLFLCFLQARAHERLECLGLAETTVATLRSAPAAALDPLAEFPGALFRLKLDAVGPHIMDPKPLSTDPAQIALQAGILSGAWHLARRSTYSARLFLAMSEAEVHLLRSMPLLELSRLAFTVDLITCAYLDAEWVWIELLTETRREYRRHLLLIGMQPNLADNWHTTQAGLRASR